MAAVQMPDGAIVDMPDQIDPELGKRLRAFHDSYNPPAAPAAPPEPGAMDYLKGAGDAALTGVNALARGVVSAPLALANRLVAAGTGGDGQLAADTTQDYVNQHFGYSPQTPVGQDIVGAVQHHVTEPLGAALGAAGDVLEQGGQKLGLAPGTVHNQLSEAGELAGTVPLLGGVAAGARASAEAAAQAATNAPKWAAAGFRNADAHPIARGVAGGTGRQALTLHNQEIGNTLAKGEAGVQPLADLSYDTLEGARGAPNAVYGRVAEALPTGPLSEGAAERIRAAGGPGQRITNGTPDAQNAIQALQQQLLDPQRQFTGQQVVNEMRGLRQEGYVNIGSEDVSKQQLGKAQLDMARGLEQHVADNLQENAPVTLDQLQQARTALAKNHAVQAALRGKDVDMQAIARMQRADPDLLTGGLKHTADFANDNIPVSGLGGRVYSPPSYQTDLGEAAGGKIESLLSPAFYTQILGGRELARRILTGNTEKAVAAARGGLPEPFRPVEPRQPAPLDLTPPTGRAFDPNQPELATGAAPFERPFNAEAKNFGLAAPEGTAFEASQRGFGGLPQQSADMAQRALNAKNSGLAEPLGAAFEPHQLSLGDLLAPAPEAPPTGMRGVMSKPEKKPAAKKKALGDDFP